VLTRPFTAVGVALPFALHGVYLLFSGGADPASRWQTRLHLVSMGVLVLLIGSLHFAWQYHVTGDALLNPYTLWWPYDKVGFGEGYGVSETGHSLRKAWVNTRHSLESGYGDLFGWGQYSWVMLPFGLLAALLRRNGRALLLGSVILVLVVIYMAYWVGSSLFGPRYYYEGLFSLTLFSAAGIAFLAGLPVSPGQKEDLAPLAERGLPPSPAASRFPQAEKVLSRLSPARPWLVFGGIAILMAFSLAVYTPTRLGDMHALYEISRENYEPFRTPEALALPPSLFIVHAEKWMPYGALIELQDPCLTSHFIFAWSRGPRTDARLAELFADREVFHYYPEEPFVFYRERHEAAPGN
jgi:hypothetical protein